MGLSSLRKSRALDRISRLFTLRASPGWFVVLALALDWISRAQLVAQIANPVLDVARKGWGFLTTPTGTVMLLIAGFVWIFVWSFVIPERRPAPAPVASPTGPANPWELLAESDDSNMPNLIHHLPQSAQTAAHLTAVDPYVDLDFGFVNASTFDLTFSRAEGRVRLNGQPLQQALEQPAPQQVVIRHGEGRVFPLRQWITQNAVAQMQARIESDGRVLLATGQVGIWFSYTNHRGTAREFRVGLPDSFVITQVA